MWCPKHCRKSESLQSYNLTYLSKQFYILETSNETIKTFVNTGKYICHRGGFKYFNDCINNLLF